MSRGNNQPKCCDREPMLRVRGIYIQYECRTCRRKGGLAILEPEAAKMWAEGSRQTA